MPLPLNFFDVVGGRPRFAAAKKYKPLGGAHWPLYKRAPVDERDEQHRLVRLAAGGSGGLSGAAGVCW